MKTLEIKITGPARTNSPGQIDRLKKNKMPSDEAPAGPLMYMGQVCLHMPNGDAQFLTFLAPERAQLIEVAKRNVRQAGFQFDQVKETTETPRGLGV